MVRVGYGYGHHHNDELDLQIAAHGVLMTVDGGQRSGYTKPPCRLSKLHNTVTMNDKSRSLGLGGVTNIVDTENFAYMNAYGGKKDKSQFTGKRQVMLVDVDDDGPTRTLPIENQKPGVKLKPVTTVPNGYVIDVFRQPGHGKHTYNFHAMINDSFDWNAIDAKKSPLNSFGKPPKSGDLDFNPVTGSAPETLIATWRMRRLPILPLQRKGTEKQWLGVNFDPKSPRKFLKLRLLGVGKAKLFKENVVTVKKGIQNSFTRVAATVSDMNGRVFAALIEPYAGKPFVKSAELLEIQGAGDGVDEPIAMRVECVNGRKDVVFMNESSLKEYAFDGVKVKGEAAMTAVDSKGLKYAMLTSGTSLATPYVEIKLNKSQYTGKIKSIDFYAKKLTLDTKWVTPESANGGLLAIRGAKHTAVYNVKKFIGSDDDQLI
ncbi:MAG: hypothetical protein KAG97_04105, partial [Victivallales bacterium]|nr:hypothetical protein [Victivallales bacterium]